MDIQETAARTPWLSVIIPIYHAEKYLQQCLDSIRSQTESDFEVLMVDDGSQDSSGEICCRYAAQDRRFRYFKKENGGAYQTRIYGAEQSCGTYVTFCDADDYYTTPDAFKLLRQYLSDGNYAAAQFGYEKKFRHLKQKKPCVQAPVPVDREGFLAREYPMVLCSYWDDATLTTNVWNKVYHRKLLSNFPSSREAERIFWGDDLIMNLHLLSTCDSFLFIPDIFYGYRQLSGGTSQFSSRALEDLDNIKKYQLYYLDRYEGPNREKIRDTLFAESSAWFYCQIRLSMKHLSEPEVEQLILDSLRLPSFVQTREYYLHESDCQWEAMELLRKADPKEYIAKGKVFRNEHTAKDAIRDFLLKIYAAI